MWELGGSGLVDLWDETAKHAELLYSTNKRRHITKHTALIYYMYTTIIYSTILGMLHVRSDDAHGTYG